MHGCTVCVRAVWSRPQPAAGCHQAVCILHEHTRSPLQAGIHGCPNLRLIPSLPALAAARLPQFLNCVRNARAQSWV